MKLRKIKLKTEGFTTRTQWYRITSRLWTSLHHGFTELGHSEDEERSPRHTPHSLRKLQDLQMVRRDLQEQKTRRRTEETCTHSGV